MIQMMTDMLHMYCAMLLYYILKLPYALRAAALIAVVFAGAVLGIHICCKIGKKAVLPLFLFISLAGIRLLQNLAFWLVKLIPAFEETGAKLDEGLNRCGIWLEGVRGRLKGANWAVWKKIPVGKIGLTAGILSCAFIIVPFYMQPSLTGNARQTCLRISMQTEQLQGRLWGYVNQYYTPAAKVRAEKTEETEGSTKSAVILHLGPDGVGGANLRSTPEKRSDNIVKPVSGDVELYFENEVEKQDGITWLKVRTDGVDEAWISKKMIEKEDLKKAGIDG